MNVTFDSAPLAALCNSEQRLIERWGREHGRTVGRRLLDLAAIDAAHLDRLPDADVSTDGDGTTRITFGGQIVVDGVITEAKGRGRVAGDEDHMVITGVAVQGGGR
ncbi:MAG: hypothetical protein JWO37_3318 [Acidimicrobiales bacterium]|nr:hypothetical protein [Acidimicrobiales bacterium]